MDTRTARKHPQATPRPLPLRSDQTFEDLGLSTRYTEVLRDALKITHPTEIQSSVIPILLQKDDASDTARRDVVMEAKTGSGKTLAFLLPIIQRLESLCGGLERRSRGEMGTCALVVVPTRELAVQTGRVLESVLGRLRNPHWMVHAVLCGSKSKNDKEGGGTSSRKAEKARLRKGCTIVVGTPGRLLDHCRQTATWRQQCQSSLRWIVLDEADRLVDLGFAPMVKELVQTLMLHDGRKPHHQLVVCSATVNAEDSRLPLHAPVIVKKTASIALPDGLSQFYLEVPTKYRLFCLLGLLSKRAAEGGKTIVFVSCCDAVDHLHSVLRDCRALGLKSAVHKLHGKMPQADRTASMRAFVQSTGGDVLVCTDVAARGVDIPGVAGVVQYEAPMDPMDYVHRVGRTARLSAASRATGTSYLLLMPSEVPYVERMREKILGGAAVGALGWHDSVPSVDGLDAMQAAYQTWTRDSNERAALARRAYASTVAAYATHPAAWRDIFHIKRLHLGQLAASFGLLDAPSTYHSGRQQAAGAPGDERDKYKRAFRMGRDSAAPPSSPKRSRRLGFDAAPAGGPRRRPQPKRVFSEFDAGV